MLFKQPSSLTAEVRRSNFIISFLITLIAIDQGTSITPCFGRILRLPTQVEVFYLMDRFKLPLIKPLEMLTTLRRSSTRLLLESKDLDGAGSYVPYIFDQSPCTLIFLRVSTIRQRRLKLSPLPTRIHSSLTIPSLVLTSGNMLSICNTRMSKLTSVCLNSSPWEY